MIRTLLAPYWVWIRLGAVVVVSLALALAVVRIGQWRAGYERAQAAEDTLERTNEAFDRCSERARVAEYAYTEAALVAESKAAADAVTAERIAHELKTTLAAADARGRDLARRLQDHRVRAGAGGLPAAAEPAGGAAHAGRDAGGDEALGAVFAACERDASRLIAWQDWYVGVAP
jgi:hypothetical protein